jgi:probable phosphoglycerate mutase
MINGSLTKKGIQQAELLAKRCATIGFDRVYSSDLARAIQTAETILSLAPYKHEIIPAFREINMGDIDKHSWGNYPELYERWKQHEEDIPYPNGENGADVWRRCAAQLEKIIREPYQKVAIVCHGGTIRSIICGVLSIPQEKRFYFGNPPENCSISIVRYREDEARFYLHSFNDCAHLDDPEIANCYR